MLLGRETHKKDALLLFTFIRVIAIHARQRSPGASHWLPLSQFWLSRTLKFLLPLLVTGTAVLGWISCFRLYYTYTINPCTREYTHTHTDAYTYMHIRRYPYTDAHTSTHTHTHHIHANAQTYTLYTYIHIQWNGLLMHLCDENVRHRHTLLQNLTNAYFPF